MQNNTAFAEEMRLATGAMLDAISSVGSTRMSLLKRADLLLGRAMNAAADDPDETGMVVQLTRHLDEMKARGG